MKLLREQRYDDAGALAQTTLRAAAAESSERLTEAARGIVAWKGFFANHREAMSSETFFRDVFTVLEELAGPTSPPAMAAENLAGILGSLDKLDEAIALRERVFAHVLGRFPKDDPRFMQVRDGLVFLYRRTGRESAAEDLFADVGLCEHLKPVERYVRAKGAKMVFCGQPWSDKCHLWAAFDSILDCEGLMRVLKLDSCVQIHDHRGTHDGSERGLVCKVHNDGVMGPHPQDAGPAPKRIAVTEWPGSGTAS
jgi:hypothetical protein